MTWLINFASRFQVRCSSTSGGAHVASSYHWRHRALDLVGDDQELRRLMRAVFNQPTAFVEAFYDPMGRYVKNGRIVRGRVGGHSDHVHLAR